MQKAEVSKGIAGKKVKTQRLWASSLDTQAQLLWTAVWEAAGASNAPAAFNWG